MGGFRPDPKPVSMVTSSENTANVGLSDSTPPPSYTMLSTSNIVKGQQQVRQTKRCSCHVVYNALKSAIHEIEAKETAHCTRLKIHEAVTSEEYVCMTWRLNNTARMRGIIRVPSDDDRCNCHAEYLLLKEQIRKMAESCLARREQYFHKKTMKAEHIRWYKELEVDVSFLIGMLRECDGRMKQTEKVDNTVTADDMDQLKAGMRELKLKLEEIAKAVNQE